MPHPFPSRVEFLRLWGGLEAESPWVLWDQVLYKIILGTPVVELSWLCPCPLNIRTLKITVLVGPRTSEVWCNLTDKNTS